jgi:transposase
MPEDSMRGKHEPQSEMFCLIDHNSLIPKDHPIRAIKKMADVALREMSPVFDEMYAATGRPSIPPERLLKGSLLMALYTVRSERLFCEQLAYNFLFKWFLDMNMTEEPFEHSTFSANRERLMEHDVAKHFFVAVVTQAREARLMSDEHFSVDGTLIDAWASMKSFRPKGEKPGDGPPNEGSGSNGWMNFKGEKRSNETHESKTDPEAKLYKKSKGQEARLKYSAHGLIENRNGLLVDIRVGEANGTEERTAATTMLDETLPGTKRITLGGDKGYDTADFISDCRERNVTPHVAMNEKRPGGSALDERTRRHRGYDISLVIRKRIEEVFGWCKTVGNFRRTRYRGIKKNQLAAYFIGAAYNLVRMVRLMPAPT